MTENPFFGTWTTPFGIPPFDRIAPEHFAPAFDRGMTEHAGEIAAISRDPEPATFANTIEAMEAGGRLLGRVSRVFFNLNSSCTTDALQAIAREYAPKLAGHAMKVALDAGLFARVDTLHSRRTSLGLDEERLRLLDDHHRSMTRSGAGLSTEKKARMAEISERLAVLHTLFGQNVLHDENAWQLVLDRNDLDGLPAFVRDAAAEAARERGLEDRWVVTLSRSSIEPFLTFSTRRDLRETAWKAWTGRGGNPGERDNAPLIREIVGLRAEQARLLGFETYAAFKLDGSMAGRTAAVEDLLMQVWEPAKVKAAAERDMLQAAARAEGMNDAIAPWDWRHYAEKVRKAEYDLDEAEVKPYFPLDSIQRAAFDVAGRLFGVSFTELRGMPAYHPDVRAYEVRDAQGDHVGIFLADHYARPGKRSGAWMSSYRDGESFDTETRPIVVNNNNFAKGSPTLLSFDDAETLFHEFGHALHGLLSTARYPSQSGTAVKRDFVEFPSQVFEHWLSVPEILSTYARHHETGAPMPRDLLDRLLAARTFNQGFATVEYTAAALLDMAFHVHAEPATLDVAAFEREIMERIGMPAEIAVRHRPVHFSHLFSGGGYAAGYYAYLWAEVLDADGFDAFVAAGDPFDPKLAAGLKAIYQAGDTREPMDLYIEFRGREPTIDALLEQRGLVSAAQER